MNFKTSSIVEYLIRRIARFLFILIGFLLTTNSSTAQNESFTFDSIHREIYHEVSQLRIIEAKKKIAILKNTVPNNLATDFVEDFAEFLSVIALSSNDAFEYYKTKNTERIDRLKNASIASPYLNFSLSEYYLHRAISRVLFGEKIKAVFDLKTSKSYIDKNIQEYPDFRLNDKTKSLLDIAMGSIPPSIKWATALISLSGNYNIGISELNQVLNFTYVNEDYSCFFPEILTYKVLVFLNASSSKESDKKSIQTFFSTLTVKKELSKNHLLLYAWCDYLIKNEQNESAITLLDNRVITQNYLPFWPLEFSQGIALQNKLDNKCIQHFTNYIAGVKSGNYVNASYQRIAWQNLINNNQIGYKQNIQKITSTHNNTEQDQVAFSEYSSRNTPSPGLLKARLLFDGGYYSKSLNELKKISPESLNSKLFTLEYYYRLARIYEKTNNYSKAIYLFNKVIIDGSEIPNYYAANAALNAGNVCEKLIENKRAKFYYKKCLTLSPSAYKESIHQKAKIGLERVK
jgi:hypothetical protein